MAFHISWIWYDFKRTKEINQLVIINLKHNVYQARVPSPIVTTVARGALFGALSCTIT